MAVLNAWNGVQKALLGLVIVLAIFMVGAITGAWLAYKPAESVGETKPAAQDKRLEDVGTQTIQTADCGVVVAKPAAKGKLNLPPAIAEDPSKHVTSSSTVTAGERPQAIITLLDQTTGQTTAVVQQLEYPWLATEQRGQMWIGYGLADGGRRAGRLMLREDLLQVKALHLGGQASVDTDGQWFAGVGVAWRW